MTWFDIDYGYKKKITIDDVKVSGDETDFPVLVSVTDNNLRDEANGGHVKNSNGYDIIFTNSAETVQLKHEIERYVNTSGLLVFWVKIPSLSSTADTDFYIYYSKTGVGADPSTTDTWDSSYKGVWHCDEGATSTQLDSTTNGNGAAFTNQGADNTIDACKIGNGIYLSGGGDFYDTGDQSTLDITDDITAEFWIYVDAFKNYEEWFGKGASWNFMTRTGPNRIVLYTNTGNKAVSASAFLDDTWYHVVGTMDAGVLKIFVNANETSGESGGSWISVDTGVSVGLGARIGGREPTGRIDECRVSQARRSNNWIATTYNTQNDPSTFMSWGSEEAGTLIHTTSDSVNISDDTLYKHLINPTETVNIDDSITSLKRLVALFDNVNIDDIIVYKHLITLLASINIDDDILFKYFIDLADSIDISDDASFKHLIELLDTVDINDITLFKHFINLADNVNIVDYTDFGGLTFIFDNISILDDISISIADTCGAVFQLQGDTYTVFLPVPEYAGEAGNLNNELVLFDFWSDERSLDTIGINTEPFILGGVIFTCTNNEEVEMTAIAAKFLNINEMMDNHEEIRITGLNNCVDAIYVIKNFRYRTIVRSPYAYAWQLTLEYVRVN